MNSISRMFIPSSSFHKSEELRKLRVSARIGDGAVVLKEIEQMDVLQLLKAEFRSRKADLADLSAPNTSESSKAAILSRLNIHLAWEAEFLLPELSVIATHGDALLEKYQQGLKRLQIICRDKSQNDADLLEAFARHTETVEEKILPFMRQRIPTVEREELYHVFADAKQELQIHV